MSEQPADHVARNRIVWDENAPFYAEVADRHWAAEEPFWGIFGIPESQVGMLPGDVRGLDTVELGCGTGYVSAWLARRGARPVGLDLSTEQLTTARAMQERYELRFPLIQANAEAAPLLDASFDLAISEYGASIWCDPFRWVPEAARLLRPGGELIFMVNGTLVMLASPDDDEAPVTDRLRRDYFGMHRIEWSNTPEVEFHLGYGDWIRLLRAQGFEVTDLIELRPDEDATTRYDYVTVGWARRWPAEQVWKAVKR